MGMFKNAWATYRAATSKQRELTEAFAAETGVNFMHLETAFHKHVIKVAMETDTETAVAKYAPLVESVKIYFGPIVTPEFNRYLMGRFTYKQEMEAKSQEEAMRVQSEPGQ